MSIDYLRISVTDRCNLRCIYCNPLGDCGCIEPREILRFEEIERIARLFAECGINKFRLTGGEPLVRKDIVRLVEKLARIPNIDDLALTTNGVLLEPLAAQLKAAGLQRINISVDSVERESYKKITGFDLLRKVTKGIHKAIEAGLTPVKINSVIIKGLNDSEEQILALAAMSVHLPVTVRFIEYCPTGKYTNPASEYLPNRDVRFIIERKYGPLSSVVMEHSPGPALNFKFRNSAGAVGFISGRSSIFCRSCNRLRLTSDGKIKPCLYSAHTYDLKRLIRGQATDRQIRDLLKRIISEKGNYTKVNSLKEGFSMCKVGG
ncbi:MAG TPA: GTP 3',8-cyclase MoaA [Sedimentisphaerales bacterium]|nr:GTP 3',8-cyclase MoaA [Sedimentisphaerales bacterium]